MSELICPICQKNLTNKGSFYSCGKHNFDLSKSGYLNLLPANKKHSSSPGDNKLMLEARNKVLNSGYYDKLESEICRLIALHKPKIILDLGCGEGTLTALFPKFCDKCYGVDISKDGILKASKHDKNSLYIVSSVNDLPFSNNSIDIVVNCFAPLNGKEVQRVLKNDGLLLKITPSPNHLLELKEVVYPKVYLNPTASDIESFREMENIVVEEKKLYSEELAKCVFMMTPYYYKTPKEYIEKINSPLEITTSFTIRVLNPID